MDIEKLTKHQIVLLALLVSFVTSIVTGVVTVSLMSQAPTSVSRTINQIVQRTVQTITPASVGSAPAVQTVVVKDDDLVAQSIATVQKSIVRIVFKGSSALIARGVIVSATGAVLTDALAMTNAGTTSLEAILPDGERLPLTLQGTEASSSVAVGQLTLGTTTVVAAPLAGSETLALGQTLVRIGGGGADTIGTGVVAALPAADPSAGRVVQVTVPSTTSGALVMTIFGQIVGITTGDSESKGTDYYTLVSLPSATTAPSHS